jgi:hypothetical protein
MIVPDAQTLVRVRKPQGPRGTQIDWSTTGQLAFSGLAVLWFFGLALVQAGSGLMSFASQRGAGIDLLPVITSALSQVMVGLLIIPSAGLALLRLVGRPLTALPGRLQKSLDQTGRWLILIWPLVIATGYIASQLTDWRWLLLPPLSLIATAVPIIWLADIARRGLARTGLQRSWGILTGGMVAAPLIATVLELAVIFIAVIAWIIWLLANPQSNQDLQLLIQRLSNVSNNADAIQHILSPYMAQPNVIVMVMVIIAGFTPLIEELCKPVAVWLLKDRIQTPQEGFAAGVISGAGFTLVESMGMIGSYNGANWVGVTVSRAGTDLLHILTAGLMGWALVAAWREGRYIRLVGTYLLVVTLHGAWNALSLWTGFGPLVNPPKLGQMPDLFTPLGLGVLAAAMLVILLDSNRRLRAVKKTTQGNRDVSNILPD